MGWEKQRTPGAGLNVTAITTKDTKSHEGSCYRQSLRDTSCPLWFMISKASYFALRMTWAMEFGLTKPVTSVVTYAPKLMQCSSSRNNPLIDLEHGSERVQHADPFRSAPGCRNQSCARGHARAQAESLSAADSAGRHFCRS